MLLAAQDGQTILSRALSGPAIISTRTNLQNTLLAALGSDRIRLNAVVDHVSAERATMASGETLSCDLVVDAGGTETGLAAIKARQTKAVQPLTTQLWTLGTAIRVLLNIRSDDKPQRRIEERLRTKVAIFLVPASAVQIIRKLLDKAFYRGFGNKAPTRACQSRFLL